jgi:hypothetical protein
MEIASLARAMEISIPKRRFTVKQHHHTSGSLLFDQRASGPGPGAAMDAASIPTFLFQVNEDTGQFIQSSFYY